MKEERAAKARLRASQLESGADHFTVATAKQKLAVEDDKQLHGNFIT